MRPGLVLSGLFGSAAALLCCDVGGLARGLPGSYAVSRPLPPSEQPHLVRLRGNQISETILLMAPASGQPLLIDARRATFLVANSRNAHPVPAFDCSQGRLSVNPYPLRIQGGIQSTLRGGRFNGRVPQSADWRATYCNSAAILFERVSKGRVQGVRVARSWDAVRIGRQTSDLQISGSWLSDVRDDAFENDHLMTLDVTDSLIDGAFHILSVKPAKANDLPDARGEIVTLSGLVARIGEFSYRGGRRFGTLAKSEPRSPRLRILNSVIAISSSSDQTFDSYWSIGWMKLDRSSNNHLLWLSDAPIPAALAKPPEGFVILRGKAARAVWTQARDNWINCHPQIERLPEDPASNVRLCRRNNWGGFA